MFEAQASVGINKHWFAVTELVRMGIRPKQVPCLIPSVKNRTVSRYAKEAGLRVDAGRHMQDTKHHLRDPAYSPAAAMAFTLFQQRRAREEPIGAEGFISIVRTLENVLPVVPDDLPSFVFTLWREYCNGVVYLKPCTECSYRYPYHRLATPMFAECSNCRAHSTRYQNSTAAAGKAAPEPNQHDHQEFGFLQLAEFTALAA